MSSTILSSLGESILHRNSLATITNNWIVVCEVESRKQILISIDSISSVKTFKTLRLHCVTSALGCLLIAVATAASKESDGATLPIALIGVILLMGAQITRRASLGFVADHELIQTAFGSLPEAATLVTAIRSTRQGKRWGDRPAYEFFLWWHAYFSLLV